MSEKIRRFLTNNNYFTVERSDYKRAILLNSMIVLFIVVVLVIGAINLIYIKAFQIGTIEIISGIIMLMLGISFKRTNNIEVFSVLSGILIVITLFLLFLSSGMKIYFLHWAIITPFFFYFIIGKTSAFVISVLHYSAFSILLFLNYNFTKLNSDLKEAINFTLASFIFLLSTMILEKSESRIEEELKDKNRQLERLSGIDTLTGLYNRNALNLKLKECLKKYNESSALFSIIMSDLDNFKDINDQFGHIVGDQVLVEVANIMLENVEKDICFGRWGGEEFLIICCDMDENQTGMYAEYIRQSLATASFLNGDGISISMGVAECAENDTIESIIKRADKALYRAKDMGRGRVEHSK